MTKEIDIVLPSNVVLIDVTYINFMIEDIKKYFERKLNRTLQEIDLALFCESLAMDAGYEKGDNETLVMLAYDANSNKLFNCKPSDIKTELDGMAFKDALGEFMFAGVPCEDMVSNEELIFDLLRITADNENVKRIIVVAADKDYDDKMIDLLNDIKEKEVLQYRMDESTDRISYRWELLVFPLMQALGIQADEI